MLNKVCTQHIYKVFYSSADNRYTYEVIVERSPNFSDHCIAESVSKGVSVNVEITDTKSNLKRNFSYFAPSYNRSKMLSHAQRYFCATGLIPNPRFKFFPNGLHS